ncbi:MAG: D-glycerate dehydrogenase [Rhodospirillaceae bacterium]|jgi:lactate dehydrogenase-like 2-hydroxyacid dehydrogenase|nr:D-glycerate dehydrogenase [Rhodospirillaceae bacterium]MBT4220304.1 D-glycerate dehydrogenase [Rhodospirillaceae bacterium]MBT4463305.1 D-glycerate dehydrogenase [Rhodospirillaceae bacterium]MBT5013890.1 D-glycerate dehydrogenase [Rhodospirillaceae bacterium]MBT6407481.1 D-glycerate dehydrogenase [Rhodospirillaceae bacterium]
MSSKPVVLVTRKLPDAVEERLKRDYQPMLNADDRLYSDDEIVDMAASSDAILPCHTEKFTAELIARLPDNVKVIANFSVGVDHCDLVAAKEKGIIVTNTPDVLSDATAEIAIMLMLTAARRASEGDQMVRAREWRDWSPAFMVGSQITGKRFGVIGMGRVGQVTAKRARCFDMDIHYYNRSRLGPDLEAGATYHETVEDLLPHCDVLSIHCPATPETTGLLNAARLALLPDGAIVVNTARGGVVDDEALVGALKSGKLWAAGLDVFNGEPEDIHPGYRELGNVFLLPHIGSATAETRDAMGFRALDNLDSIFAGREPGDRVA